MGRSGRIVTIATSMALLGASAAAMPTAGAAPGVAGQFAATGAAYWDYAGNEGNGAMLLEWDGSRPGLAPGQAEVTFVFHSGLQPFFLDPNQSVVSGDWSSGWTGTIASPPATVHLGPYGDGRNITIDVVGFLFVPSGEIAEGPWEVHGTFTPVSASTLGNLQHAPDQRFIGRGVTQWAGSIGSGYGDLVVDFDATDPSLQPGEASVTYVWSIERTDVNGTQIDGEREEGQGIVTGDWVHGWVGGVERLNSQIQIGPWGTGTNISFSLDGNAVVSNLAYSGPWTLRGNFSPVQPY